MFLCLTAKNSPPPELQDIREQKSDVAALDRGSSFLTSGEDTTMSYRNRDRRAGSERIREKLSLERCLSPAASFRFLVRHRGRGPVSAPEPPPGHPEGLWPERAGAGSAAVGPEHRQRAI